MRKETHSPSQQSHRKDIEPPPSLTYILMLQKKLHRLVCVVAVISPSGKEEGFENKVSYSRDAVIEFETTTLLAFIGVLNPTDANILFSGGVQDPLRSSLHQGSAPNLRSLIFIPSETKIFERGLVLAVRLRPVVLACFLEELAAGLCQSYSDSFMFTDYLDSERLTLQHLRSAAANASLAFLPTDSRWRLPSIHHSM